MSLIDPYQIATCGQNFRSTYTLASNGILINIVIQDITEPPRRPGGATGFITYTGKEEEKKKSKKKVTVTVTIEGKDYIETIIVENRPELKVEDVKVDVTMNESNKPIIKITLLG